MAENVNLAHRKAVYEDVAEHHIGSENTPFDARNAVQEKGIQLKHEAEIKIEVASYSRL